MPCATLEVVSIMFGESMRRRFDRRKKIRSLLEQLDELLNQARLPPPDDKGVQRRGIQRLIVDQLAALRLEQAEDRLLNNFMIAVVSALGGILAAVVGMHFFNS